MRDNSTIPGPMGWGVKFETEQQKKDTEVANYERIAAQQPMFVTPRDPKPVNETYLQRLKDEMGKDGIEEGVSVKHLEPVVTGNFLKWLRQIVGSCVASGYMRIALMRMFAEIFLLNQNEEVFGTKLTGRNNLATFAPYNYRAGRSIANINSGDGSYCSVHVEGAMKNGHIPCWTEGLESDTFPEPQNARLYRRYGNNDQILRDFNDVGQNFKLLESVRVQDESTLRQQLIDGFKPMMICSMWAFEPDFTHRSWRLRDGSPVVIYKRNRRTSWAHNMSIVALVRVGNEWFVIVDNSWGDGAHRNGSWFAIPLSLALEWFQDAECRSCGELDLENMVPPV